jgi:thymidylate synthase
LSIRQVAHTIFPNSTYENVANKDAIRLFDIYNRKGGMYDRLKTGWGTYFRRMTHLLAVIKGNTLYINQLAELIDMLKKRKKIYKSAYTITISAPGIDNKKIYGGPCLNSICLQLSKNHNGKKSINLLAIYRNHNFVQRAFGNYVGLGQLLNFICEQCLFEMGSLTCISSHATLSRDTPKHLNWPSRSELKKLVE